MGIIIPSFLITQSDMTDMSSNSPSETTGSNRSMSEDLNSEFIFQDRSSEDNANIIAMRSEVLLGKTVQGTLIKTIRKSGKTTFWVRWNKRKCDAVLVRSDLIENALGATDPKEGTQISCKIVALGPDISKLQFKSAWCMHPQANEIEVISHGYINPPNPLKQAMRASSCRTLSSLTRSGGHRPRFFNSRTNSKKGSRKKEGSAFWRRDSPTSKSVSKGIILTRPDRREGSGTSKHWSD